MNFAKSPIIGTVSSHHFFEGVPFVAGLSLQPVPSSQIATWNIRVGCEALTATEAADQLAGLVSEAVAELTAFGNGYRQRAADLKALVADAVKLAECPVDLANDRAVIEAYAQQAAALAAEQPPASTALKNADALSRWIDRCEGLDRIPILAALDAYEKALATIGKARAAVEKALADLQGALVRLDAPETLARLASMKLQRDLSRALPVIQEFIEAEAEAAAALARMQAAGLKLKALAQ
ncbi:hypothetical protein FHW79_005194 [Azospirillum sp. OGB3]|uniref:hypothetical protein n=1 Tax=Azospirillum sp. OGB3 TaxID=2587012 RepID=UPI00160677D9|nr:hypothetical protein [Azospirillum sp. OGB3]MBB3267533.1 hypothetical protein [Azospirillum sp. OGB3]